MFDLAWSEIALIGVVALVVIGPKDLPEAVRGLAKGVQKLRRMAGQFQQQADDLVREANLDEVRQQINDIRNFNIRDTVEKAVDGDGTIRKTFTEDPLRPDYAATGYTGMPTATGPGDAAPNGGSVHGDAVQSSPMGNPVQGDAFAGAAPAFVPPAFVPPATLDAAAPALASAFIPPAEAAAVVAPPAQPAVDHPPVPEPAIRSA